MSGNVINHEADNVGDQNFPSTMEFVSREARQAQHVRDTLAIAQARADRLEQWIVSTICCRELSPEQRMDGLLLVEEMSPSQSVRVAVEKLCQPNPEQERMEKYRQEAKRDNDIINRFPEGRTFKDHLGRQCTVEKHRIDRDGYGVDVHIEGVGMGYRHSSELAEIEKVDPDRERQERAVNGELTYGEGVELYDMALEYEREEEIEHEL